MSINYYCHNISYSCLDLVKGSAGGMSIYDLVTSGINYLDTRFEHSSLTKFSLFHLFSFFD